MDAAIPGPPTYGITPMFGWLRSIYGANPSRMRALSGLTLDLAPRQPSIGNRCLLAGAYLIMLLLVALPALCPAMGSGAQAARA